MWRPAPATWWPCCGRRCRHPVTSCCGCGGCVRGCRTRWLATERLQQQGFAELEQQPGGHGRDAGHQQAEQLAQAAIQQPLTAVLPQKVRIGIDDAHQVQRQQPEGDEAQHHQPEAGHTVPAQPAGKGRGRLHRTPLVCVDRILSEVGGRGALPARPAPPQAATGRLPLSAAIMLCTRVWSSGLIWWVRSSTSRSISPIRQWNSRISDSSSSCSVGLSSASSSTSCSGAPASRPALVNDACNCCSRWRHSATRARSSGLASASLTSKLPRTMRQRVSTSATWRTWGRASARVPGVSVRRGGVPLARAAARSSSSAGSPNSPGMSLVAMLAWMLAAGPWSISPVSHSATARVWVATANCSPCRPRG
mmetsp:Transcript_14870/g.40705  ORF Transcript_14870/g.40705 Transcript_14870/m.40705 type:complete len:365 (+) Transcript_14870:1405-2499(+)